MSELHSTGHGWRLAALSLAMLLPSLGISVANIALPSLQGAFEVTSQQTQWVVIAYLVAVTSSLVTAGRLGDLLGRKAILLLGIAIFSLASLTAIFAPSIWMVVLARGVQGVGAAMMMSLTIAAVSDAVPAHRSGTAMGLLGTVSAIGTAAGPSLGGLLVEMFGWPSIFVLMSGAGLLAALSVGRQLPAIATVHRRPSFDVWGALTLMVSVAAFALASTISPFTFNNIVLGGVAVLGVALFFRIEGRAAAPLIKLDRLRPPGVAAGLLSIGLVSAIVMTTLVVGLFYLIGVLSLDTATAGFVMTIGPTVSAIVGLPAGRIVDRTGWSAAGYFALFTLLSGTVAMMLLPSRIGLEGYVVSLVLITSGYALFQAANNTALIGRAPKDQRGVTSALLALARNVGLITGASAMGTLFAVGSGSAGVAAESGLQVVFATATMFVLLAIGLSVWAKRVEATSK